MSINPGVKIKTKKEGKNNDK
jgi:hypothetical protein